MNIILILLWIGGVVYWYRCGWICLCGAVELYMIFKWKYFCMARMKCEDREIRIVPHSKWIYVWVPLTLNGMKSSI